MAEVSMLTLYNKDNAHKLEGNALAPLASQLIAAPEEFRANRPVILPYFPAFSLAVSLGFQKVTYNAKTGGAGGEHFYWIDPNHASLIGQALSGNHLEYFGIEFTTVANSECWKTLADEAKGATVRELCIAHKSGDEETPETCAALAYLCTKLKVQTFHLWCAEYEDGSIDAFVKGLEDFGNKTLQAVDICDVSLEPPEDEVRHSKLDEFVAGNRQQAYSGQGVYVE